MTKLIKLKAGDKVAILSPSFAAPGIFPEVYELGLKRLRDIFQLEPVEFPTTRKLGASTEERAKDLITAFENKEIKGVIASIGGNDQVTYIKNLPSEPFTKNPKPFYGFSDNSHFMNFLWLNGIPSFYGGSVMTQLAMQKQMDDFTVEYLKKAFFESGEVEIRTSKKFNEIGLSWADVSNLDKKRKYESNNGWFWDGSSNAKGILWGGCLESVDEMLRNGVDIPSLNDFKNVILMIESSEEIPSVDYVHRVCRAFGERGILEQVRGVLVGRPKAWEFDKPQDKKLRKKYREDQRKMILKTIHKYNPNIPVIQNLDFGHTDPQIAMPYGGRCKIDSGSQKIVVEF